MKLKYAILTTVLIYQLSTLNLSGQSTNIPYYNNFDSKGDTLNWLHYAISGTDDWKCGAPAKTYFTSANSNPNAWATNLNSTCASNSTRALETPYFNLKDTAKQYVLSFYHKRESGSASYYLEYSINNGKSWSLLNNTKSRKKNWQSTGGFSSNFYSSFENSVINLRFLQGKDSVKFRFRFLTNTQNGSGWMIDDFSITPESHNLIAYKGDSMFFSQNCQTFSVKTDLGFNNQYDGYEVSATKYYFSYDKVLDLNDALISTKYTGIYSTYKLEQSINLPSGLAVGYYYIFYKHDANDTLKESDETDNISYAVLKIDTVYKLPFIETFDIKKPEPWKAYPYLSGAPLVWEQGMGRRHHIEGAHSGGSAWHTSKSSELDYTNCIYSCLLQYVESPKLDFSSYQNQNCIVNFWFKAYHEGNALNVEYNTGCSDNWIQLGSLNDSRSDDWDYVNFNANSLSANKNVSFRVAFTTSYHEPEGLIFDDFYAGPALPDLSIEKDLSDRFTNANNSADTLKYFLNNSIMNVSPKVTQNSVTDFYWSQDSILDGSDVFLGSKTESGLLDTTGRWTTFPYTKPTTTPGKYYIFYKLDKNNLISEMREFNNTGYFTLYQSGFKKLPYFNDFETQIADWRHNATLGKDNWVCAIPKGRWKDEAFSGKKAWLTSENGDMDDMSREHLYTPVFDLRNTNKPVMEFDMINYAYGSCNCSPEKMNISYSIDGGANWQVLDTTSQSYNRWYYPSEYDGGRDRNYMIPNYSTLLFNHDERAFALANQYNTRDAKRNTRYNLDISFLAGRSGVQFRFNIADGKYDYKDTFVKGAMIDNFSIKEGFIDLLVDYKKSLMLNSGIKNVKFYIQIKNNGNYYNKAGTVKFYLSADPMLDSTDFILGQALLDVIRPDHYSCINLSYKAPQKLNDYRYLIYYLDATNKSTEKNESNNVGYWSLGIDSTAQLPYFNDFSDSVQVGWHQYSIGPYSSDVTDYRFRNYVVPAETYQALLHSGEYFTDRMISGFGNKPPIMYLETPGFNFENDDSIFMSFDLMCTGRGFDGGTMRYSIDGGDNWLPLDATNGHAYNWYNYSSMSAFNNAPGWAKIPDQIKGLNEKDSTSVDLSLLKGQKNVRFQFVYNSNCEPWGIGYPAGMRLDNLLIVGTNIDLIANDSLIIQNAQLGQKTIHIDYTIEGTGNTDGRGSLTKFYWSKDSILDSSDPEVLSKKEKRIKSGELLHTSADINIPDLDSNTVYYLFYILDGDFNLNELSEINNKGWQKIQFQKSANYQSMDNDKLILAKTSQPFLDISYNIKNNGSLDGKVSETRFFWSQDSLLDISDVNVKIVKQDTIRAKDISISKARIIYPVPVNKSDYYLFYKVDYRDSILEFNEKDNTGSFKIIFNYKNDIQTLISDEIQFFSDTKNLFVYLNSDPGSKPFDLKVYNTLGQIVYSNTYSFTRGMNKIDIRGELSVSCYFVCLDNGCQTFTKLFYLNGE